MKKVFRSTFAVGVMMIAAMTAQAQNRPLGAGEQAGDPRISMRSSRTVEANRTIEVNAHTGPTGGTTYEMIPSEAFKPYFTGVYDHSTGRTQVSGSAFYSAAISLPFGATLTEVEFYVIDNGAGDINTFIYRGDPSNLGLTEINPAGKESSTGASTSNQTLTYTGLAEVVPSDARWTYFIGADIGAGHQIVGAKYGYTTAQPTRIVFLPAGDRFVDTRPGTTNPTLQFTGPFSNGGTFDFQITGITGRDGNVIPSYAKGVFGNVTAVSPGGNGLFKILPGGTATTIGTSTVNFNAGFTTANSFQAKLDSLGRLRAYFAGTGNVNLLIDVAGYYY